MANLKPPLPCIPTLTWVISLKVSVSGLGDRFIDKVNDAKEDVLTDGIQTFPDRTDRVYLNPQDCSVINDEALNRIIAVGHQHHLNVVGWNPGPALSVSMGRHAG